MYIPVNPKKPKFNININGLYEELNEKKVKNKCFNEQKLNGKYSLVLIEEYFLSKRNSFNNRGRATDNKENNFAESKIFIYEDGNSGNSEFKNSSIISNNPKHSYISGLNNSSLKSNISSSGCSTNINNSFNRNLSSSKNISEESKIFNKESYNEIYLDDLPLYEEKDIDIRDDKEDNNYVFLNNDLTTNNITKSDFLEPKINELNDEDIGNCNYYPNLGLYFCGKEVKLENEKQLKKCCPNEFICKSCMDINKKKYNIKNNFLINIKGRVAKINNGSYHCSGHFLCGNQNKDCISEFSCNACKMLDSYSKYYI